MRQLCHEAVMSCGRYVMRQLWHEAVMTSSHCTKRTITSKWTMSGNENSFFGMVHRESFRSLHRLYNNQMISKHQSCILHSQAPYWLVCELNQARLQQQRIYAPTLFSTKLSTIASNLTSHEANYIPMQCRERKLGESARKLLRGLSYIARQSYCIGYYYSMHYITTVLCNAFQKMWEVFMFYNPDKKHFTASILGHFTQLCSSYYHIK